MSAILVSVFKATIGLILNKGRDKAAEKLKDGDITDQKFRSMIVREIDEIKSKLDGISRKDLLSSISFFKEGVEILYSVLGDRRDSTLAPGLVPFEKPNAPCEDINVNDTALSRMQPFNPEIPNEEPPIRMLTKAKKKFEWSSVKATEAFHNQALGLADRILAMKYRVMATVLESIDNYREAFPPCQVCLDELHAMPEVQNNFKAEIKGGFMSRFGKEGRIEVISSVCQVNRAVWDVFGCRSVFDSQHYIVIDDDHIDPLRDYRVGKALKDTDTCRRYCVIGSFGGVQHPRHIGTNSRGDFIITAMDHKHLIKVQPAIICVSDKQSQSLDFFNCSHDEEQNIIDIATNQEGRIFVLLERKPFGSSLVSFSVWVFEYQGQFLSMIHRATYNLKALAVANNRFCVCDESKLYLYDNDGDILGHTDMHRFHKSDFSIYDIAYTADYSRLLVIVELRVQGGFAYKLHRFSETGCERHEELDIEGCYQFYPCHMVVKNSYMLFVGCVQRELSYLRGHSLPWVILMFTDSGQLVRTIPCCDPEGNRFEPGGLVVTSDGRIAITDTWRDQVIIL